MKARPDTLSSPFVISRRFDAPRALVFEVFSTLEHLQRWMSPAGMEPVGGSLDFREGGCYHYGLRGPDGQVMWGKWTFREIKAPERLVTIVQFSDAEGGVTRHPWAPGWPLYTLSTTSFEELDGQTLMTLRWQALNASEAEAQLFEASTASMEQGWSGTMVQLERYLDALKKG